MSRAVASLLGVGVLTIAVVGALTIWHLIRRGRMIRSRLGPPREVRLPDPRAETERDDASDTEGPDDAYPPGNLSPA